MSGLLTRRELLAGAAGAVSFTADRRREEAAAEAPELPRPRPAQLAWQQAELGAVFHYDLHVFDGLRYVQSRNRREPIPDPNLFQPDRYDMDQWVETAKAMGARFALLTASHETGFRLWQSDVNPYCMKALRWRNGKADLVKDFVEACRRHRIRPGIYMGARWNSQLGVLNWRVTERSPLSQAAYNRLIEREVEEICSRYGELFELWFDGGILSPRDGGPDVLPIFEKHQPRCLFYHSDQRRDARWGGSESGTVPYPCWAAVDRGKLLTSIPESTPESRRMRMHGDPEGRDWCPAMSDAPVRGANRRHEWFWEPGDEPAVYPTSAMVEMYYRSVGHNSTLILGLTPDPHGRMPEPDVSRLAELGREIRRRFGKPLAEARGLGSEVVVELRRPARIDHVVIQEGIAHGERVREYQVSGRASGSGWRKLAEGTCIGHKRIHRVDPVEVAAVRLTVTRSAATPLIRRLSVYGE